MGIMKDKDRLSAPLWMGGGILVCALSYRLKLGAWQEPGPGFLPFFAGLVLALFSAIVFFQSWFRKSSGEKPEPENAEPGLMQKWKVFAALGALLAYVFLLDILGFSLSNFFLFTLLLWGVERIKVWKALVTSLLCTAAVYLIFVVWLKVQMPAGLFS
jgi:putative tricarboxylic transport membrane protein